MTQPAASSSGACVLNYHVSYPDTDAAGVVNHGRYIDMAERARHDLLKRAGLSYASLSTELDTLLVVHKLSAVYHAPGVLEDSLQLSTGLALCSAARTVWVTHIHRAATLLATVTAELAALHAGTKIIRRHPDILLSRLAPFALAAP